MFLRQGREARHVRNQAGRRCLPLEREGVVLVEFPAVGRRVGCADAAEGSEGLEGERREVRAVVALVGRVEERVGPGGRLVAVLADSDVFERGVLGGRAAGLRVG